MKLYLNCLLLVILFTGITGLPLLPKNLLSTKSLLNLGSLTSSRRTPKPKVTTRIPAKSNVLSLQSTLANVAALTSSLSLKTTTPPQDDNNLISHLSYPLKDTVAAAADSTSPSSVPLLKENLNNLISPLSLLTSSPLLTPNNVKNVNSPLQSSTVVLLDKSDSTAPLSVPLRKDIIDIVSSVPLSRDDSISHLPVPPSSNVTDISNLFSPSLRQLSTDASPNDADLTTSLSAQLLKDKGVLTSRLSVPFLDDAATVVDGSISPSLGQLSIDASQNDVHLTAPSLVPLLKDEGVPTQPISVPLLDDAITVVDDSISPTLGQLSKDASQNDADLTAPLSVPLLKDEGVPTPPKSVPLLDDDAAVVDDSVSPSLGQLSIDASPNDADLTAHLSVPLFKHEVVPTPPISVLLLDDAATVVDDSISPSLGQLSTDALQNDADLTAPLSVPLLKDEGVPTPSISVLLLDDATAVVDDSVSPSLGQLSINASQNEADLTAPLSVPLLKDEGVPTPPKSVPLLDDDAAVVDDSVSPSLGQLSIDASPNDADLTALLSVPLLKDEVVPTPPISVLLLDDAATVVDDSLSPSLGQLSKDASQNDADLTAPLSVPLLKDEGVPTPPKSVPLVNDAVSVVDDSMSPSLGELSKDASQNDADLTAPLSVPLLKDEGVPTPPKSVPLLDDDAAVVDDSVSPSLGQLSIDALPKDADLTAHLSVPLLKHEVVPTPPISVLLLDDAATVVDDSISPSLGQLSTDALQNDADLTTPLSVPLLKDEGVPTPPLSVPLLNDAGTVVDDLFLPSFGQLWADASPNDADLTPPLSVPLLKDEGVPTPPKSVPLLNDAVPVVDDSISPSLKQLSKDASHNNADLTAPLSVPLLKDEGVPTPPKSVPLLDDAAAVVDDSVSLSLGQLSIDASPNDADLTAPLSVPLLKDEGVPTPPLSVPLLNDAGTVVDDLFLPSFGQLWADASPNDADLTPPLSVPLLKDEGVPTPSISVPLLDDAATVVDDSVSPSLGQLSIDASPNDADLTVSLSVPLLKDEGVPTQPISVPLLDDAAAVVDDSVSLSLAQLSIDASLNEADLTSPLSVPLLKDEGVPTPPISVPLLNDAGTVVDDLILLSLGQLSADASPNDADLTPPLSVPLLKDEGVLTSPISVPLLNDAVINADDLISSFPEVLPIVGNVPSSSPDKKYLNEFGNSVDGSIPQGNLYCILSGIPGLAQLTGVTNLFSNLLGLSGLLLALPTGLSGLISDITDALIEVDGLSALLSWILAVLSCLLSAISASTQLPLGNIISSIPLLRPLLDGLLQISSLTIAFSNGITGFIPGWGYSLSRLNALSLTGPRGLNDVLNSVLLLLCGILSSITDLLNGVPLANIWSRLPHILGMLEMLSPGIDRRGLPVPNTGSSWSTHDYLRRYRDTPLIDVHNNVINVVKIVLDL